MQAGGPVLHAGPFAGHIATALFRSDVAAAMANCANAEHAAGQLAVDALYPDVRCAPQVCVCGRPAHELCWSLVGGAVHDVWLPNDDPTLGM